MIIKNYLVETPNGLEIHKFKGKVAEWFIHGEEPFPEWSRYRIEMHHFHILCFELYEDYMEFAGTHDLVVTNTI